MEGQLYERRRQTQVKHYILRHYLERFAHIVGSVGSRWTSITYVDGFAGPWNVRSPELSDSSFAIALNELRRARGTHRRLGKEIRLRCFFLEQNRDAYLQLREFASKATDAEIEVRNQSFESSVPSILDFIKHDRQTFPFLFIDPTGWTGFALRTISPLLRLDPGEVLVNFMTGHIRRFLNEEHSQQSFEDLFGSSEFRERLVGLSGPERDDAAVALYTQSLKHAGGFPYVLPAIILHPEINRAHFHLIYASRHPRGAEVFKGAEKRAMVEMEKGREHSQRKKREERSGQQELALGAEKSPPSQYYIALRDRYLSLVKEVVLARLRQRRHLSYDEVWLLAISHPLVWESDLRMWIQEWSQSGHLSLQGLSSRERVPKRGSPHFLVWQEETHV